MNPQDQEKFPARSVQIKNGDMLKIRFLQSTDAIALAAFYAQVPMEDYRFYCPHPLDDEHANRKTARADGPNFVCLVLENSTGEIVGYASYEWKDGADKSGMGICISRQYQGQGAGRLLIQRLLEVSRQIGPVTMSLTVQKANPNAVTLYTKLGFKVIEEQMRGSMGNGKFPAEPEFYMEWTQEGRK